MDAQDGNGARAPLWQRIARFPLVTMAAMLIALLVPLGLLSVALQRAVGAPAASGAAMVLKAVIVPVVIVTIYKFTVRRIGEIRRDDMPLDARSRDAARGALIAFALMSLMVGVAWTLGAYRVIGWGGASDALRALFVYGLYAAVMEELLIRGVVFRYLEEFGGSWFALAFSSALFGALHLANPGATAFSSLAIAVEAGILLGGAYMLTRNLWLAIGLHFGWNVTQGFIWDVPVSGYPVDGVVEAQPAGAELLSGGVFGLEASLIGLVAATAVGIAFVTRAARRGNVMRPWWVRRRLAAGTRPDQTKL